MKINLFLIRHAESEINCNKLKFFKQDPHITKKGIEQCKELKNFLIKNILSDKHIKCFCSILLRTQETALLSIPYKKIYISNYLKEIENMIQKSFRLKLGNFPNRSLEKQKERLKNYIKPTSINRLQLLDPNIIDKRNNYRNKYYNEQGDINLFLEHNKNKLKENDTIIIVCHGQIIKNFLHKKERLKNCSFIQVYNDETDKSFHLSKEKRQYDILFKPSL